MKKVVRAIATIFLLYAAFFIVIRDVLSILSMQPGNERTAISEWIIPDIVALIAIGYSIYSIARKTKTSER